MPSVRNRIIVMLAVLACAAAVSSCHSAPDTPVAAHNEADVAFARNMIPHHQQAVDMSALVPTRSTNQDLIVIARRISVDQQAEIETMQDLLGQWGEPAGHDDHAGHHGHGAMDIAGMVDPATMSRLESLTGADFDALWLRSMISHHKGAIKMAQPEIAQGENPTAVKMAKIIVEWQQFEIARMTAMLSVSS